MVHYEYPVFASLAIAIEIVHIWYDHMCTRNNGSIEWADPNCDDKIQEKYNAQRHKSQEAKLDAEPYTQNTSLNTVHEFSLGPGA